MEQFDVLQQFSMLDGLSIGFILLAWIAIGWRIEHPGKSRTSVTMLMEERHKDWLKVFVTREPRIFDSQVLGILRQGTAFFASTSILALGGILVVMGNVDFLRSVASKVNATDAPELVWQIKLALVAFFTVNAFLKFVWAHRVFGYGTVLMGGVPNDPNHPQAYLRAEQAADLNFRAVMNFNRGLRALYFALGAIGWLLGPVALMFSTVIVLWVLWSREFASLPRTILLRSLE